MSQRSYHKKLRVEQLEAKTLLASDVSAAVFGGHLFITGDGNDNEVLIENGDNPDEFVLIESGGGSINGGGVLEEIPVTGVTRDIYVNLKGGNDAFRVIADLPDDLYVWGGDGDDTLFLGLTENLPDQLFAPVSIAGDVIFVGGEGADLLNMRDYTIGDDLAFFGGNGDDQLLMEEDHQSNLIGSSIGDDATIKMGDGEDEVTVEDTTIGDDLVISTGSEDDVVGVVSTDVGGSMVIFTSSGDDEIELEAVSGNLAIICTDGGEDEVAIIDSAFEALFVSLGSGDDTLEIEGEDTEIGLAILWGGSGEDELSIDGDATINFQWEFSFEV